MIPIAKKGNLRDCNNWRGVTAVCKLEVLLAKRRLRWLGHVLRIDDNRISKQALNWSPVYGKIKRGRPRKNWKATVLDDLRKLNMDWDETKNMAVDRRTWRSYVAQCASGTWMD